MNKKLYVVMYHYVRDLAHSRYPNIKGLDYSLFKEQIQFLKKNFAMVTMEEVIEAYNSNTYNLPEKACLLTFDDGYIDNYTYVFPILKKEGIQGSFFIPGKTFSENILLDVNKIHFILANATVDYLVEDLFQQVDRYRKEMPNIPSNEDLFEIYATKSRFDSKEIVFVKNVLQTVLPEDIRNKISTNLFEKYVGIPENIFARELYMNREQINCMKNEGMYIGVHGYDHYWLGNLSAEQMKKDIDMSLTIMDEFIDKDSWVINYPYGSYNEKVIKYIAEKGCKLAMTTDVRVACENDNRFLIPRLDCNDFPPKSKRFLDIRG